MLGRGDIVYSESMFVYFMKSREFRVVGVEWVSRRVVGNKVIEVIRG